MNIIKTKAETTAETAETTTEKAPVVKGINIPVRMKNPIFWKNLVCSVFIIILTQLGLNWSDITTWSTFGNVLLKAVSNPVIVVAILLCIYNAIIDPTTKGLSDSVNALSYTEPK